MPLQLEITTPEGRVYQDTADEVVFMTKAGELTVLPGHIPLLTMLESGALHVVKQGKAQDLAVDVGFVRVMDDKVDVLTEAAINVEKIDADAAEQARKRAQEALEKARAQKDVDQAELDRLEAVSRFAIAQLLAKGRHRH